jgi:Mg-chelatase subunit ChlD
MTNDLNALARWRLILGRFADDALPGALGGTDARMDAALDFLYGREYRGRGARDEPERTGGLGGSAPHLPDWIREVRDLFPRETVEIVEHHALDRYGMTGLVTDPAVLGKLEPNYDLLRTILTFKGMMQGEVLEMARHIVRQVVEDLKRRLEADVRRVLSGKLNRFQHSPLKVAQNFDWRRTVRDNLRHYDPEQRRLVVERMHFFSRVERHLPWRVILAVDQSGSMLDSTIHSAVMAGILAGLPALTVNLVVFDTSVVDLTGYVDDPTEALLSVQLGGGTDIASALAYCETLVENPLRTIVVVVTDFYEGGRPDRLVATVKKLREAGVKVLGLAALDQQAQPVYDRKMAERLAAAGAEIAALTPLQLAEWLMGVIR